MTSVEKQLWQNIKEGDLKAFQILFDTYYSYLFNYACGMLISREDAEEIVLE